MMKRKTGFATIGDPIDRSTCRPPAAQTRRPMNDHSIAYMAYGMYQAHKHTNATQRTARSSPHRQPHVRQLLNIWRLECTRGPAST